MCSLSQLHGCVEHGIANAWVRMQHGHGCARPVSYSHTMMPGCQLADPIESRCADDEESEAQLLHWRDCEGAWRVPFACTGAHLCRRQQQLGVKDMSRKGLPMRPTLLCGALILLDGANAAVTSPSPGILALRHWSNWIYSHEAHHWHSLWCRWKPSGEAIHSCHAERIFTPADEGDGNRQRNVYHFEDERGTVSEGRMSGPWYMTSEMSTDVGVVHPFAPAHTTLLCPGGPCVWANMAIKSDVPLRCELFLHGAPPSHLRMSASVVYTAEGELSEFVLWREDDRGPWPSAGWSASRTACAVDSKRLDALTERYHPQSGDGDQISAVLEPEALCGVPWGDTRAARTSSSQDAILLCADGTVRHWPPPRP